ncbi:hypothetical protein ACH7BS_24335 [Klebsiella aerogenes]|uniref:hypothetical protein n=1 Tax=Klebsiella aerogenes TaxID=548 RepID=UPI00379C7634
MPEGVDEAAVLLRLVEGAGVALRRSHKDITPELLPLRPDLFQYSDGYSWGYKGSGCQNLANAIVGRGYEFDNLSPSAPGEKAWLLLEGMISGINKDVEYTLDLSAIRRAPGDDPRTIF